MNFMIVIFLALVALAVAVEAQHTPDVYNGDEVVEIVRQRLVKFPDETDMNKRMDIAHKDDKKDEVKRILQEIEKINKAMGYVKKQPDPPKLPPILDSSQFLFPNPAYQPFHAQNHEVPGSHGDSVLVPSIRALKSSNSRSAQHAWANTEQTREHNAPPKQLRRTQTKQSKKSNKQKYQLMTLGEYKDYLDNVPAQKSTTRHPLKKLQYYFRPNEVTVPAPQTTSEQKQLPTHFVIPVRLFKLNKEEYIQKHAPQEYKIKGYKIVGDIDNFYGKAKPHATAQKSKSKPKYHLFFLPREVALNGDSTLKQSSRVEDMTIEDETTNSRDEKLSNHGLKIQYNNNNNNKNITLPSGLAQIIRKRITPQPVREKQPQSYANNALKQEQREQSQTQSQQHLPHAGVASNSLQETDIDFHNKASTNTHTNSQSATKQQNETPSKPTAAAILNPFTNMRPNLLLNLQQSQDAKNQTNVIKNAFQNFFKFPFRPDSSKPDPIGESTFFATSQRPQQQIQHHSSSSSAHQTQANREPANKWQDDESNSNSAGEENDNESASEEEKQLFGHRHKQQQETHQEALKQGGIIIQRLKVRRGGIAIAGPGGVATAGSGGTAIVGPGGYALTHPRSLTIAGPGAKVIAIPPEVELKDALQQMDLKTKTLPREGKIVATGPTIYYAPPTAATASMEEVDETRTDASTNK